MEKTAVQRKGISQESWCAEADWRIRLQRVRAGMGPADFRSERDIVGIHGRRTEDRHPGRRDGEGQHASGARSGRSENRPAVRGIREEDRAENRGAEIDAHAWR